MSVMRKALLASTNVAARPRDQVGVRPAIGDPLHARRARRGRARAAAKEQQKLGSPRSSRRLGENLTKADEVEEVTQHYLDGAR